MIQKFLFILTTTELLRNTRKYYMYLLNHVHRHYTTISISNYIIYNLKPYLNKFPFLHKHAEMVQLLQAKKLFQWLGPDVKTPLKTD